MGKYYLEDRVNVNYKDISKYIISALVSTEDKRFYDHNGIDPVLWVGRFFHLAVKGPVLLPCKRLRIYLPMPQAAILFVRLVQKLKESIIAIKLERNFTKDEIITLYLNTVPFSDNVYGIRNAAKTFFFRKNLTV